MIVAISGSMSHISNIQEIARDLEAIGDTVYLPNVSEAEVTGVALRKRKPDLIKDHYTKIRAADVLIVANYDKKGIKNYIGGNTLIEMAFAYALGKSIYLMNNVPEMDYTDEIHGLEPKILHNNINELRR